MPVPSIKEQARIVAILDRFDALCNDLTSGLPAEIAARQKQYEYYRDLLLSFDDCSQLVHVERERERPERRDVIKLLQYVFGYVMLPVNAVADVKRGVRVIKSQLSSTGKYPVYQNSMTPLGYYNETNCPANTAFVISAGAAGEIGFSSIDFWAADDCLYLDCSECVKSRYLYYALQSKQTTILAKVRRASVPRLSRTVIERLALPIPTLKMQENVVSILDRFDALCNDLTSGLPAEIEARQRQYEYYRDKLLTFKELNP